MKNNIFEELKKQALYAQRSFSGNLLYETYGEAKMAFNLGVITHEEFMAINTLTVVFMNTDKAFIKGGEKNV